MSSAPTGWRSGPPRARRAIAVLRAGGIVAILAAVLLGPPPPTDTSAGGVPTGDALGQFQLTPAARERARALEAIAAEPEAHGCSAVVREGEVAPGKIVVELHCRQRGVLAITVGHRPIDAPTARDLRNCLSTAALPGIICEVSGRVAEPDRGQLIAAFERVFARTFTEDPFTLQRSWDASAVLVAVGIAALAAFLWLTVTGTFTFGSWGRGDWIALLPFAGALVVREWLTLHTIQEIEIQFALTPVGRHSIVYPLFQLFYSRLVTDAQAATFHVNGVLGALATLPLYLFVRQRTGDRAIALVVGCLFAVDPIVARFAPTDSPYSFLLFTWFSGLALLSTPAADARSTLGGAVLLGIAASSRMDGAFYLAASALMLDPAVLWARLKQAPRAAALGVGAIALLIGAQMYFLLGFHWGGMHTDEPPLARLREMWDLTVQQPGARGVVWAALIATGACAGIARRWRLGLAAFAAVVLLLLTLPLPMSPLWISAPSGESPNAWHRLVPSAAIQCVVAGIGAVALVRLLLGARRREWAVALPGIAAALYVLWAHHGVLGESYVFNDEYAMLRGRLLHDGTIPTGCDLFVMTRVEKDVEIRDFRRVLPGISAIDCSKGDCAASLSANGCQYYLRSAACFFHSDGVPERCRQAGSDEDILRECLLPQCAALESAAALKPIEERYVAAWSTFPREAWNYPQRIPISLFSASARPGIAQAQIAPRAEEPMGDTNPDARVPEASEGTLVLPPNASAAIGAAFARMGPALRYDEVSIDGAHVAARLCPAAGDPSACFGLRLDAPSAGCAKRSGPFCVTFTDGAPSAAAESTVEMALTDVDRSIWVRTGPNPRDDDNQPHPEPPGVAKTEPTSARTWTVAAALIAIPIALGALIGWGLRRLRGRRLAGLLPAAALLIAPIAAVTGFTLAFPLIGIWDALLEGSFVGIGLVWTAHRAVAGWPQVALATASLIASLLLLEAACRLFLPPPPAFPDDGGPHLLLADAMRAGTRTHSWDVRSKEIVCSLVYGPAYPGILDVSQERDIVMPQQFNARSDAKRRVLHVGDSMTFGFGVARDQTFTADLERLEPGTQHINGGIPGTAPDAYLLVLRQWLRAGAVDLAVMYLFEGNDVQGMDDRYPCCDWESLFTYDSGRPSLRCPTPAAIDLAKAGPTWLRYNSPAPYLLRAAVGSSAAAAHMTAAIVQGMLELPMFEDQSKSRALEHLEAVLRSARDELRQRDVPFVVVVFPERTSVEHPAPGTQTPSPLVQLPQRLGIPVLDAAAVVRQGVGSGRPMFFDSPSDPHFTAAAHELIAEWLHDQLATAADLPPAP